MGTYITTKCGHCNVKWEFLNSTRLNIKLGPPIIKCSSCNGLNKTKHKLYRDMNTFEKVWLYVEQTFLRFIFNLGVIIMGFGMLYGSLLMEEEDGTIPLNNMLEIDNYFGIIIFLSIGLGIIWFGFNNLKQSFQLKEIIKIYEETHDKNGGFIWSHEYYEY